MSLPIVVPKIIRAPGVGRLKPRCTARLGKPNRLHQGPDGVCGKRADYLFDGQPRCASHAAQTALSILYGNSIVVHGADPKEMHTTLLRVKTRDGT